MFREDTNHGGGIPPELFLAQHKIYIVSKSNPALFIERLATSNT